MKIGIISDLHLEFRHPSEINNLKTNINSAACDVILDAGDLHPYASERLAFSQDITARYLHVMGNHDYYRDKLSSCKWAVELEEIKVVGATLWTDFMKGNPLVMMNYKGALADGHMIQGITPELIYQIHSEHLQFIADEKPSIVVTHHTPSWQSVHPIYANAGITNYYFSSKLEDFILANPNIKYWIHGHTHMPFNYMIGNCNVICNPCGYPNERKDVKTYHPKVIV